MCEYGGGGTPISWVILGGKRASEGGTFRCTSQYEIHVAIEQLYPISLVSLYLVCTGGSPVEALLGPTGCPQSAAWKNTTGSLEEAG